MSEDNNPTDLLPKHMAERLATLPPHLHADIMTGWDAWLARHPFQLTPDRLLAAWHSYVQGCQIGLAMRAWVHEHEETRDIRVSYPQLHKQIAWSGVLAGWEAYSATDEAKQARNQGAIFRAFVAAYVFAKWPERHAEIRWLQGDPDE